MVLEKGAKQSNLESFLYSVTPVVPSDFISQTKITNFNRHWYPFLRKEVEYFTLSDFWYCFDESSVYGTGVPITLDNGNRLIQYYEPYLSAVEIYINNSSPHSLSDEKEADDEMMMDSLSEYSYSDGSSCDEGVDRLGYSYFQYFEQCNPYGRYPLMDKVNELSQTCPGLMSLRSVDLSPASWMSVAWYPIYPIPMGKPIKDLSTCFLTYHTLSSSFLDADADAASELEERKEGGGLRLSPFGLATYKLQGNLWLSDKGGNKDQEKLVSMLSVADSWLKQLRVDHHDFNYFTANCRS